MPFELAILGYAVLDVESRDLRIETRVAAHGDTARVCKHLLFQMTHLRVGNLPPLEIVGIFGDQSTGIGIQRLLFRAFQLEMQYVQPIVDVRPDAYPFGDMRLSDTRRGEEAGQLPPQVAPRIQGIEIRDVEPRYAGRRRVFLFLLAAAVPLEAFREGLGDIDKGGAFEREACQPLGIFPQCLLSLVLPVLVVELPYLGIDRLQPHSLDVIFEHVGHHLDALSLVVLTEGVDQFDGVVVLLKGLRQHGIRRRRLVGAVM